MAVIGKNINLFLIDGITNGRIKYSNSNWTGLVYKIPRQKLDDCNNIPDLKGSGVYFLFGEDEDTGRDFIYIGQANVRKIGEGILLRVKEHVAKKKTSFWHTAILVVKKDDTLGGTEINYLENKFYNLAREANDETGRYTVLNEIEPNLGNYSEEIKSDMEIFISEVLPAVGVLGFRVFDKFLGKVKTAEKDSEINEDNALKEVFTLKSRKSKGSKEYYSGRMVMTLDGVVLLKGSEVNPNVSDKASPKYKEDKMKNQVFLDENNRTTKDLLFDSPTGAAVFVVGYSISGPKNWKNKNNKTIEQLKI